MSTLVIHAPNYQVILNNKKSFQKTLDDGIGKGYAINQRLLKQIHNGCPVILLSKDEKRRATGTLEELVVRNGDITNNHIQRYNVHINDLCEVPYQSEELNRNGVAVIR
jgi:hypothetical protein